MTEQKPDPVARMILTNAREGIQEARLRSEVAIEHLSRNEALAAIGVLTGVKERARYAINILQILFQWRAAQQQKT
jgi:hypothetical protein